MPGPISGNIATSFKPSLDTTKGAETAKPTASRKRTADDAQLSAKANKSEGADSVKRPRVQLRSTASVSAGPAQVKGEVKTEAPKGGDLGAFKEPVKLTEAATKGADTGGERMMATMREMNELNMKFTLEQAQIQSALKFVESAAKSIKNVGDGQSKLVN